MSKYQYFLFFYDMVESVNTNMPKKKLHHDMKLIKREGALVKAAGGTVSTVYR